MRRVPRDARCAASRHPWVQLGLIFEPALVFAVYFSCAPCPLFVSSQPDSSSKGWSANREDAAFLWHLQTAPRSLLSSLFTLSAHLSFGFPATGSTSTVPESSPLGSMAVPGSQ